MRSDIEFHVCVIPPSDPRVARELARHAQELHFDRFWVSDQTFHADPFVLLADLADRTSIPLASPSPLEMYCGPIGTLPAPPGISST